MQWYTKNIFCYVKWRKGAAGSVNLVAGVRDLSGDVVKIMGR